MNILNAMNNVGFGSADNQSIKNGKNKAVRINKDNKQDVVAISSVKKENKALASENANLKNALKRLYNAYVILLHKIFPNAGYSSKYRTEFENLEPDIDCICSDTDSDSDLDSDIDSDSDSDVIDKISFVDRKIVDDMFHPSSKGSVYIGCGLDDEYYYDNILNKQPHLTVIEP